MILYQIMMEKNVKKWDRLVSWSLSLITNLAILYAILHTTEMFYESNDDFAIAQEIVAGYPFVGFVNYYLCRVLIFIQNSFPEHNIFVISQIAMSFIAFTVILKIFFVRRKTLSDVIIPVLACAFFALDHYSSVQFTKTASLLMICGMLWLADNYIHERRIASFILAIALFYIGVAYRQKGMFPILAYAGTFMFIWLALNYNDYYKEKAIFKEVVLIIALISVSIGAYGFDMASDAANASTPALKYAREYQAERVKATDYPLLNNYRQNKDKYDEIGIDENDLTLINRWIFDYDGAASLDNLKKINSINYSFAKDSKSVEKAIKQALKSSLCFLLDIDFNGMHFIIIGNIVLYILLSNKPKSYIYVVGMMIVSLIVYSTIFYMQRTLYRALYVADISATFWLIYASIIGERLRKTRILRWVSAAVAVVVMINLTGPALTRLNKAYEHNKDYLESETVLDYFASHEEYMFIGPTSTMGQPLSYMTPLKRPTAPSNVTGTGGWETLTPYKLSFLENYGIHNPVKDLIDSKRALFYGGRKIKILKEYYRKWYCEKDEEIMFIKVDEVDGSGIYQVVKENNNFY